MNEVKIIGYEDSYGINELGEVFSLKRVGGGNRTNTRFQLKGQISNNGYRFVTFSKRGKLKRCSVHRLVATHFLDAPGEGKTQVNHINGDKLDNRLSNLEWASTTENQIHSQKLGLSANGERSHLSKLTEKQVLEIRELYKPRRYTAQRLAKEYGMSESGIFHILKGECWKYIKNPS